MSNSINYKIQKYNYKLKHATNKKEASIYQAKLRQYKQQQSGGTLSPDIITTLTNTFNNALGLNEEFQRSDEMINQLTDQFRRTMDRLRKECCDKGKNTAEMRQKIEAMEQDFTKLMRTLGANTKEQINTKITGLIEGSDQLRDQMRDITLCPPTGEPVEVAQVAKLASPRMATLGSNKNNLFEAAKKSADAVKKLTETASDEQPVPTMGFEVGEEFSQAKQGRLKTEVTGTLVPKDKEEMYGGGDQIRGKRRLKY